MAPAHRYKIIQTTACAWPPGNAPTIADVMPTATYAVSPFLTLHTHVAVARAQDAARPMEGLRHGLNVGVLLHRGV